VNKSWDVIIVGLGAVGSAALYQLARRGVKALGLDRFHPPHDRGSSHGETRITRLAVGEGEQYVQFVRRSHEIWRELEAETRKPLLRQVGALIYGRLSGRTQTHGVEDFLQTTIAVAQRHGIRHELLDSTALAERFPQFIMHGSELGYFEPEAGFVYPEACIAAQLSLAKAQGAELRLDEKVLRWEFFASGVRVITERGQYEGGRLILCSGPWIRDLLPELSASIQPFRQVQFWFKPEGPPGHFTPDQMPVFIRVPDAETEMFYGFPAVPGSAGGLKLAGEQFVTSTRADALDREVGRAEVQGMHALASPHIRISPQCLRTAACLYTVTPDSHFVIDHHPHTDLVWFASACSGHGFKHSAAVGETLAELASSGKTRFDLEPFRMQRFADRRGRDA
jgi:sarcosine oxidase